MSDNENTYSKIIKSTSIFGGVQLVNLFISVVKFKFLAILIGPAGYGILSLLNNTVDLVRQATGFSIETSGVKKISESKSAASDAAIAKNAAILIRLSLLSGIAGTLIVIVLSKYLSIWTFGNNSQIAAIIWISVSVLLKQLTGSKLAVIQGLSKLGYMAKANLYGSLIGFILSLPLFIFFKIDAIVPSILLSSLISFLISVIYYKKLGIKKYNIDVNESFREGKEILFFGGLLSISGFLPILSNYLIQLFVNNYGGISEVGLLNVGLLIINTYVGIVFTAMSTEYYPRLASMSQDDKKVSETVNQQAIISMLIILPIIVLFIGFSPLIIRLLFSNKFDGAIPLVSWAIIAMFFKAVSWSMGYVIIARADSKVFVKTAMIFNIFYLLLCIGGYHLYGLEGIGLALVFYFSTHMIAIYLITRRRYNIVLTKDLYQIFGMGFLVCFVSVIVYHMSDGLFKQIIFIALFVLSLLISFKEIDKRVHLKSIFVNFMNRRK